MAAAVINMQMVNQMMTAILQGPDGDNYARTRARLTSLQDGFPNQMAPGIVDLFLVSKGSMFFVPRLMARSDPDKVEDTVKQFNKQYPFLGLQISDPARDTLSSFVHHFRLQRA